MTGPDPDVQLCGTAALRIAPYRGGHGAVPVGALDGDAPMSAATGRQMEDHAGDLAAPLVQPGLPVTSILHGTGLMLGPARRGCGVGHRSFDQRKDHARVACRNDPAFPSVMRPHDEPMRPSDARIRDAFWCQRGYAQGTVARCRRSGPGEAEETG